MKPGLAQLAALNRHNVPPNAIAPGVREREPPLLQHASAEAGSRVERGPKRDAVLRDQISTEVFLEAFKVVGATHGFRMLREPVLARVRTQRHGPKGTYHERDGEQGA